MSTAPDDRAPRTLGDRLRDVWANPQARYPILVVAYLALIGFAFNAALPSLHGALDDSVRGTAVVMHVLLELLTDATTLRGNVVTLDGFAVAIILECVGLFEMVIYSACVIAFPAPVRTRLVGVALGCVVIYAFNVLRIGMLLVVGRYWNDYFDFFHVYFWQATLIAIIVSVLYGWIRFFVRP